MKRKDFYIEYYNRTDRIFSDKIIWGKEGREKAHRKGQCLTSKFERKIFIITQYLTLLLFFIPIFDRDALVIVPIAFLAFLLQAFITDFSIIKVELLYSIYKKDNICCTALHNIFLGEFGDFLDELKRATKKEVTGYVLKSGGKFYAKYYASCRNPKSKILLIFKRNKVVVKVNEKTTIIIDDISAKEQLLSKIATVINNTSNNSKF